MNLPPIIKEDWTRKAVALICACLIWVSVHRQIQEEEVFRDIPVTIKHGDDITLLQEDLPKVNVSLRSSKKRLNNMTNADIKVIGLIGEEATAGRTTILLRHKNVDIPRNIEVVNIQPDFITVYIDKVAVVQDIPIRCRFTGQLPEGYGRKSFFVVPKTVQISGPSKIVNGIKEVVSEPIELDQNIFDDFEVEVPLIRVPHVTFSAERVKVHVELYKMKDSKFFGDLDLQVLSGVNTDFHVEKFVDPSVPKVEAVLSGPKSTIDILTGTSLRPFIDISDITVSGVYRLPVHLWVDAKDCSPLEIRPMIVEVRIRRRSKVE